MNDTDLQTPQLYINRELSFLEFNQRVLDQAKDSRIPLLERVKFLCISCANLDEFFEIRVASLKELLEAGAVQGGPDGLSVQEQLKAIRGRAVRLVDEQYQLLNDVLMPELSAKGVVFVSPDMWTEAQAAWLADYFSREVEPVLSPLALDPARPFPKILNKSLNFAVVVEGEDGSAATAASPWCRRRGPCRASSASLTSSEAGISCSWGPSWRPSSPGVRRHEHARLLSISGHPQQRPVRRAGGSRRPAARGRGRARLAPLRRRGALGDRARLSGGDSQLSAGPIRPHRATIYTRSQDR